MKLAIMADIHSNHIALERCVEEAKRRGAEEFIFLGDYIGDLPCPEKTISFLKDLSNEYPCTFIRGNKEDYWINRKKGKNTDWIWEKGKCGSGILAYAYERLTPAQIDGFERLPISKTLEYPGLPPFVICHGSPWKASESLRQDYDYIDSLTKKLETELTVCGHFHVQTMYERNGKRIINPGSVGVALRSGGKSQFMMLTGENGRWDPEFITLSYDIPAVIREMEEEKLHEYDPAWTRITKHVLNGSTFAYTAVLERACVLCTENTGSADWRNIPGEYWEMAIDEFEREKAPA